jgi:CNT family concentrative nucleoside transporter
VADRAERASVDGGPHVVVASSVAPEHGTTTHGLQEGGAARGASSSPWSRLRSGVGLSLLIALGWVLSTRRSSVSWRLVGWGVGLQVVFALIVLRTPLGVAFFDVVNGAVHAVLGFAEEGGRFVFGNLVADNVPVGQGEPGQGPFVPTPGLVARSGAFFAFRIFPGIIFVSSLMTVLYHLGVMQVVVRGVAWVMRRTLRTSGAETLCTASSIFVGIVEAPLVVKPYIERMTESELMAVMTAGMATVSGGVLAAYAGMMLPYVPDAAGHLIAASFLSAPAALVMAKLLVPETDRPATAGTLPAQGDRPDVNVIDAAARGAADGLRLALVVAAMLIAFLALVSMANAFVGWTAGLVGVEGLTLESMMGWVLAPMAWLLGVPWGEAGIVGRLIGVEAVLNEFVAFVQLESLLREGVVLSGRSRVITIYALASFANFGSVAMTLAGLGGIAPSRRHDLARLGLRAMAAGLLGALMTAAVAGMVA